MDKQIYRCCYTFLPPATNQSGGNAFLRAFSKEQAAEDARKVMQEQLVVNGLGQVPFEVEVYFSSMEEVELYRVKMDNPTTDKGIN